MPTCAMCNVAEVENEDSKCANCNGGDADGQKGGSEGSSDNAGSETNGS